MTLPLHHENQQGKKYQQIPRHAHWYKSPYYACNIHTASHLALRKIIFTRWCNQTTPKSINGLLISQCIIQSTMSNKGNSLKHWSGIIHWTQRVESADRAHLPNQEKKMALECKNKGSNISSIRNREKNRNRSEILFPIIKVVMCMLCDMCFTLLPVMYKLENVWWSAAEHLTLAQYRSPELYHCFCVLLLKTSYNLWSIRNINGP